MFHNSFYAISSEEDNDDIVEILDSKCPRLKKLYGSYYISEIIGRHPESNRKVIVPEVRVHNHCVLKLIEILTVTQKYKLNDDIKKHNT